MFKVDLDTSICLKEYLNDRDYEKIRVLENLCITFDNVNLKLELNHKMNVRRNKAKYSGNINEFLYYIGDKLVGYLGICSFGEGVAEINGMVDPDYRERGIFRRLCELAIHECRRRGFKKILLLSDEKSASGISFIKSANADYAFSECKMELSEENMGLEPRNIKLRKALNLDAKEISRQNSIYFGIEENTLTEPEAEEINNRITYMIELKGRIIGKIRVTTEMDSAYISGFGIVPEYRGKGFGRETLSAVILMLRENNIKDISLDVETKNMNALKLYKSCGFVDRSIMNYYENK